MLLLVVVWGCWLFFVVKTSQTTTVASNHKNPKREQQSGERSVLVCTHKWCSVPLLHQMLPGTLHSTLRRGEWPLPYDFSDERDGVCEEENLFSSLSSVLIQHLWIDGWLLSNWKCQKAATCQLCLHYIIGVIFKKSKE